jgi:hypothetical protein
MKTVSIKTVIGKILRDMKITDMSYIADLQEWIPEAMDKMYIQRMKVMRVCTMHTDAYGRVGLPDNFSSIVKVAYKGYRIKPWHSDEHISRGIPTSTIPTFVSTLVKEIVEFQDTTTKEFWASLVVAKNDEVFASQYGYLTEPGLLVFSLPDVYIDVVFYANPVDSEGFPLIPDDAYALDAIYWYCRSKIICSGHLDPVYGRDDRVCEARWEQNAGRAQRIDYPTTDEEEAKLSLVNRLVFPVGYFNNNSTTTPEQYL